MEMRLTDDVTTYHVAFPEDRQGGRSFGAVGADPRSMRYVADASYSFYFDSLEKAFLRDKEQLRTFFETILGVLLRCDASGFDRLDEDYKRVAVDFIAVYIAEQYRNLVETRGKKLRSNDWDNAHLQTTLLASFHSGQTAQVRGMFFEGEFTNQTYDTWDCVYKNSDRNGKSARGMRLRDYTQANTECKRSGVNKTRDDWERLTSAIAKFHQQSPELVAFKKAFATSSINPIRSVADFITKDANDYDLSDRAPAMLRTTVDYLMLVQRDALVLTEQLQKN